MLDRMTGTVQTNASPRRAQHHHTPMLRAAYRKLFSSVRTDSLEFHLVRGRIWYGLGLYEKAASDFRMALRLNWRHEQAAVWIRMAEMAAQKSAQPRQPDLTPAVAYRPIKVSQRV
jgi:hypothetical protein